MYEDEKGSVKLKNNNKVVELKEKRNNVESLCNKTSVTIELGDDEIKVDGILNLLDIPDAICVFVDSCLAQTAQADDIVVKDLILKRMQAVLEGGVEAVKKVCNERSWDQ